MVLVVLVARHLTEPPVAQAVSHQMVAEDPDFMVLEEVAQQLQEVQPWVG
jgi:predicted membrane-bound dolichyl-phosphate-mannose-protein mannosyltransferase